MSFSSWLCQFSCLFLQAQVKSWVVPGEQRILVGTGGSARVTGLLPHQTSTTQSFLEGHLGQAKLVG